ncbi:DMT family transporter [Marilutibacter alkalisoli]|uniref:DMT family transporter n=1 Tax=Marilutibacter alkalisoli TaxID=2591633 RepID=UPI001ABE6732|nr:DMT family transporter [Lysobacter alkalisoli]
MNLHRASGQWRLGLSLSLFTALCWATLPIALKIVLEEVDAITLTWFRFLVATVITGGWLAARGRLHGYGALGGSGWLMLLVAGLMLLGNYVFYLLGVQYTTPANTQLLIQLAPLLMALGGIWVFGEHFRAAQWLGLLLLVTGLVLFSWEQWQGAQGEGYLFGSSLVVIAAVVWAGYALLQKQLLLKLGSMRILLGIYALSTLALWPFASPSALLDLDLALWLLLGYCALNTIGAYGAFAEALAHWEASRVSAVLATTPLLTIAASALVAVLWPGWLAPERIAWLGWTGAGLAVAGSAVVSLMGRRATAVATVPPQQPPAETTR